MALGFRMRISCAIPPIAFSCGMDACENSRTSSTRANLLDMKCAYSNWSIKGGHHSVLSLADPIGQQVEPPFGIWSLGGGCATWFVGVAP
jgi:hypothetical protein